MKSVSSIAVNTIGIEEWNQFTMKQIESITKIAEEYGTQQARLAIEAAGKIAKQINERGTQSVTNEGASTATLEDSRGEAIGFVDWFTKEKSQYAVMYGDQSDRFADEEREYTIEELYSLYLQSKTEQTNPIK